MNCPFSTKCPIAVHQDEEEWRKHYATIYCNLGGDGCARKELRVRGLRAEEVPGCYMPDGSVNREVDVFEVKADSMVMLSCSASLNPLMGEEYVLRDIEKSIGQINKNPNELVIYSDEGQITTTSYWALNYNGRALIMVYRSVADKILGKEGIKCATLRP